MMASFNLVLGCVVDPCSRQQEAESDSTSDYESWIKPKALYTLERATVHHGLFLKPFLLRDKLFNRKNPREARTEMARVTSGICMHQNCFRLQANAADRLELGTWGPAIDGTESYMYS